MEWPRASIEEADGGLLLRCSVNDLAVHAARLLAFGCRLEVRSPPELSAAFTAVAERARAIANQHESANGGDR